MSNPITRTSKGAPLTHTEMDSNLLLLQEQIEKPTALADGSNASGTWDINITGTATGITEINPISKGGTGEDNPSDALLALGGYPLSNPANFMSIAQLSLFLPTRITLGIQNVSNIAAEDMPVSIFQRAALNEKIDRTELNVANGIPKLNGFSITLKSNDGEHSNQLSANSTANRQYTFPDRNITVAGLDDITGNNSGTNTGDESQFSILSKLGIPSIAGINTGDQTKESLGIGNVENKSVAQINAAITLQNIINACGYTPQSQAELLAMLGAAGGIAQLGLDGFIKSENLPPSIIGGRLYKGTWDPATNIPMLVDGVGEAGDFYRCSGPGNTPLGNDTVWVVDDTAIYNGTVWNRIRSDLFGTIDASDVIGLAPSATTDTTNASNITSGTLAKQRLPALTGDVTSDAGTGVMTIANTGVTAGTFGSSTKIPVVVVNSKGQITGVTVVDLAFDYNNLLNKPTTAAQLGIADLLNESDFDAVNGVPQLDASKHIRAGNLPAWLQSDNIINSIDVDGPLSITAGSEPTISIAQATALISGFLSNIDYARFDGKQNALGYIPLDAALKGVPNGIAELGADNIIKRSQLPSELFGGLVNKGVWNPVTNVPPLQDGVGTFGNFYMCDRSGSFLLDGNNIWLPKDLVLFSEVTNKWVRIEDGGSAAITINGRSGPSFILSYADITGLAPSATTDTTNAANITNGILPGERLPAYTGSVVKAQGSTITALSATGVGAGVYGASNKVLAITVNTEGRISAITETTIDISDARILNIVLAGLSTSTNATITASDTIKSALGKLQAQISGFNTQFSGERLLPTTRGYTNGTLIQSSLNYTSNTDFWLLEITGNSNSTSVPYSMVIQGVIASGTMTNLSAINRGLLITGIKAFNYNGKLCFWFPVQAASQGFIVHLTTVNNGEVITNLILNVPDVVKPTVTKEVDVSAVMVETLTSQNYSTYIPPATASDGFINAIIFG